MWMVTMLSAMKKKDTLKENLGNPYIFIEMDRVSLWKQKVKLNKFVKRMSAWDKSLLRNSKLLVKMATKGQQVYKEVQRSWDASISDVF